MKIHLVKLLLTCRQSIEEIDLSASFCFFHGKISAGKSSIARLIDYCLGGSYERTPALKQELVSVSLAAEIEAKEVVFERDASPNNEIQVTWREGNGDYARVLAPIQVAKEAKPIWGTGIYNFSDLMFSSWVSLQSRFAGARERQIRRWCD
jgi:AAA domain